ncbi:MAG TPA: Pup--protein ligase [Nitrospiraceae bacterium]|jgi:proteasome accessory factor A|nr:Pup--protein ligase [Nitrospiraceae bacterium]
MKQRIFGLENEYGLIFSPNGRIYLPMEKVLGYIFEGLIPNSWPSNAFLVNGARFYQDTGCHPEYSTPECDNVMDLVVHDKAGERLLEACLPAAEERLREEGLSGEIYIFKNNTDSLGNTYGCHENYLMRRDVDFWKVTEQLIPFFVTRQIYAGAGKVLKVSGKPQYFISQRAQHIHEKTSSSTTSSRSIINTRDEPHADAEKYRRLHIIVGDSNMSEYATYLKVGVAALVLSMIEDGYTVAGMELEDPVKAIREISRDPTLKKKVKLDDGRQLSAIEIQRAYLDRAQDYLRTQGYDPTFEDVLAKWADVLDRLENDPMQLTREIDWVSKKLLIQSFVDKKGCGWDDPRVFLMDLQYHDVKRTRGLYYLLESRGMTELVVNEDAVQRAMSVPPQTTRAKVRGDFIRFARAKNRSYTVDWTYLKLNGYWEETILCMDPFSSINRRVEELVSQVSGLRFYR